MFLPLRHLSAKILAAAAQELFPEALLLEGKGTALGFYYDFIFPFEFKREFLSLLEEKMRFIIKEKRPIRVLEMVPQNASEFLKHHGQEIPAEIVVKKDTTLVQIFQMGSFIDYLEDVPLGQLEEIGAFKLQQVLKEGEVTRIVGTAFVEKQQLKEFLKKQQKNAYASHIDLGEKRELFVCRDEEIIWLPQGLEMREQLIDLVKHLYQKESFSLVATGVSDKSEAHRFVQERCGFSRSAELFMVPKSIEESDSFFKAKARPDLFEYFPCMTDCGYVFYMENALESLVISSLQFIAQIPKILGFKYEVVLVTAKGKIGKLQFLSRSLREASVPFREEVRKVQVPVFEVRVEDSLGREWPVSSLVLDLKKKAVIHTLALSIERTLALLLETAFETRLCWQSLRATV